MSGAITVPHGGRAASLARRQALSAGKVGLPPPAVAAAPEATAPVATPMSVALTSVSGRFASMERRRTLSAGKAATANAPVRLIEPSSAGIACTGGSCREVARARRAEMSRVGRADRLPCVPRLGTIEYAPKVIDHATQGGQRVTGMRIDEGRAVTGDERGNAQPVSGTQYIDSDAGGWRAGGPKVGRMRTAAGLVVSGTMVRSKVRVTGDEAGAAPVTGEADQRPDDDLTERAVDAGGAAAQFRRQADPHGATVFGANLGRSARSVGSRDRTRAPALEATESGQAITGSALGRSVRVTGDETGACRHVTGSQYLAPARRQAECGFQGGGTAPAAHVGADRADPVTAGKVAVAQSWGGQRVTGMDVEHHTLVTGDASGTCAALTGSQYQGRVTVHGWCDPSAADAASARMERRTMLAPVTGDTPVHDGAVTGIARGAGRDITGTPYYRADEGEMLPPSGDPVAAVDARFSVRCPQRAAQRRRGRRAAQETGPEGRITGSFAVGAGMVTGNFEFLGRPRTGGETAAPAHARLSGEGRSGGRVLTGSAWDDQPNVTGTEAAFAALRNPSERAGKPGAFAGAGVFKAQARREEPKENVTGVFGYVSKTGVCVTMSGGTRT